MKRILLVLLTAFAVSFAAPTQASADAGYTLTENQALALIINDTTPSAYFRFNEVFAAFGVPPCVTYEFRDPCWEWFTSSSGSPNRTGQRTIWVTANHFSWFRDFGNPNVRYRVQYRGRVSCTYAGACGTDMETVTRISDVQPG